MSESERASSVDRSASNSRAAAEREREIKKQVIATPGTRFCQLTCQASRNLSGARGLWVARAKEMTGRVARAVPVGRRWGGGGGRGGSKRLRGDGGRFNGTRFWNIRDCDISRPDRDSGLRRRRWVVRRT